MASIVILDLVEADDLVSRKRLAPLVVHSKACAGGVQANICKRSILALELGRTGYKWLVATRISFGPAG